MYAANCIVPLLYHVFQHYIFYSQAFHSKTKKIITHFFSLHVLYTLSFSAKLQQTKLIFCKNKMRAMVVVAVLSYTISIYNIFSANFSHIKKYSNKKQPEDMRISKRGINVKKFESWYRKVCGVQMPTWQIKQQVQLSKKQASLLHSLHKPGSKWMGGAMKNPIKRGS